MTTSALAGKTVARSSPRWFCRIRIGGTSRRELVDLSIRDGDGLGVVALNGEFGLADAPGVASHLITAVAACGPSVIVDLAALEGIGYTGVAVLLRIRKWTRPSGGDLPLAAPQPPVHRILTATGLIDVFSVYPSVDEAAGGAKELQREPSASQRLDAAAVPRCGGRPPVCRAAHHGMARPLRRTRPCRPRYIERDICVNRRSPGGRTTA
ncbi:MAG: STAS domain-containing protein [Streptosporangiaceae bacterium]